MTCFNILSTNTNIDEYPDQVNVAVTIELDTGNVWYIQTDRNGDFSQQANCEVYLNDCNDSDFSSHTEFVFVIETAQEIAKDVLKSL